MLWVFTELNILAVLQILRNAKNSFNNRLKYFLTQALGSVIIFIRIVFFLNKVRFEISTFWGIIGSLWKLGLFPFHLWFFNIRMESSWTSFFILSSVQKVIPIVILEQFINKWLWALALLNRLFVVSSCFFQRNLKKVFVFSSLFSIRWIILSLLWRRNLWLLILTIYRIILWNLICLLTRSKNLLLFRFSQFRASALMKLKLILLILVLRGFPPLAGFFLKVLGLKVILKLNFLALALRLVLIRVLIIIMYLRFIFNLLIISELVEKVNLKEVEDFRGAVGTLLIFTSLDYLILILYKSRYVRFWFLKPY